MGVRFRKSIKIAPGVRINFNKKSTSMTFGKRGLHYTVSSTGKKTASIGVPGTGVSYSTSYNNANSSAPSHRCARNNNPSNNSKKSRGCFTSILTCFLLLGVFAIIIALAMSRSTTKENSNVVTDNQLTTEQATYAKDTFIMYTTTSLNVRSGPGINYSVLTILQPGVEVSVISEDGDWSKIEYDQEPAYVSTKYLSESIDAIEENETIDKDESTVAMVWVSYSGSKYHNKSSCSGMKSPTQISLKDALRRGFAPCKKCY